MKVQAAVHLGTHTGLVIRERKSPEIYMHMSNKAAIYLTFSIDKPIIYTYNHKIIYVYVWESNVHKRGCKPKVLLCV